MGARLRRLVYDDYPDAKRITLVMDNLNTHTGASLCEALCYGLLLGEALNSKRKINPTLSF